MTLIFTYSHPLACPVCAGAQAVLADDGGENIALIQCPHCTNARELLATLESE